MSLLRRDKDETFMCPRRAENGGGFGPGPDTWRKGGGLVGQKRSCSYCGSMNPDDFMQALRDGAVLGPTDKSYKAYIGEAMTDQEISDRNEREILNARKVLCLDEDQAKTHVAKIYEGMISKNDTGKFYYQHLSENQMREFIDMINNKTMKIGYPGHIYVRPFFIAR